MMKKRVIGLAAVIAVITVASILMILYFEYRADAVDCYAEVYRDDELLQTIDLTNVKEPYQIRIAYGEDEYNVLEVRRGSIGIAESSCPDHLCEHMGFVHTSLMPITCLPNHLVIRIVETQDQESSEKLDGLTY